MRTAAVTIEKVCRKHGLTAFYVANNRCRTCELVKQRRAAANRRDAQLERIKSRELAVDAYQRDVSDSLKWQVTWERIAAAFRKRHTLKGES